MNDRNRDQRKSSRRSPMSVSRGEKLAWVMLLIVVIYVAVMLTTTYQGRDEETAPPARQSEKTLDTP